MSNVPRPDNLRQKLTDMQPFGSGSKIELGSRAGGMMYQLPGQIPNIGALIIRISFWGPLYYKYNKEPTK